MLEIGAHAAAEAVVVHDSGLRGTCMTLNHKTVTVTGSASSADCCAVATDGFGVQLFNSEGDTKGDSRKYGSLQQPEKQVLLFSVVLMGPTMCCNGKPCSK